MPDKKLCEEIYEQGGVDLRSVTEEEIQTRLQEEQGEMRRKLEEIERILNTQEQHVSSAGVWEETVAETPAVPIEPDNTATLDKPAKPKNPNPQKPQDNSNQPDGSDKPDDTKKPDDSNKSDDAKKPEPQPTATQPSESKPAASVPKDPITPTPVPKLVEKGTTGNLEWVFYDDGKLTISGNGEMPDYEYSSTNARSDAGLPAAPWRNYAEKIKAVVIDNGVISIGGRAFVGCSGLISVGIPESVTAIGACAFWNCISLESIRIPVGVKSIGANAFYGCSGLQNVYFGGTRAGWIERGFDGIFLENIMRYDKSDEPVTPGPINSGTIAGTGLTWKIDTAGTLTISGTGAIPEYDGNNGEFVPWNDYSNRIKAVVLENGVTGISSGTFSGSGLTGLTIPASVTSIGAYAFNGCKNLKTVNVHEDNTRYVSADNVIFNRDKTELVLYPAGNPSAYTMPESVTSIGEYAFGGCEGLTSLTISSGVTSIGGGAFENCRGLTSLDIPSGVVAIGEKAFYGCSGLTSVNIPVGVKSISDFTFCGCTGLKNMIIPDSVESIGVYAFAYCEELISITIPDGIKSIGGMAFTRCKGLTGVSLPAGVAEIGVGAFAECTGLTSMSIPEKVTAIEQNTFYGCSGLTSVKIPVGVTRIDYNAFGGCDKVAEVWFGGTVDEWTKQGFGNHFPDTVTMHYEKSDDPTIPGLIGSGAIGAKFVWKLDMDGKLTISGTGDMPDYTGSSTEEEHVPWYQYSSDIKTVLIEYGVTSIGTWAFSSCSNLKNVTILDSVREIGNSAFNGCSRLESVIVSKVLSDIGEYAFNGCSSLRSVEIPASVINIGSCAFSKCSALTSVKIPDGVSKISWGVFSFCSSLTSVTISGGVISIGDNAFQDCNSIKEVWFNGTKAVWEERGFGNIFPSEVMHYILPDPVEDIAESTEQPTAPEPEQDAAETPVLPEQDAAEMPALPEQESPGLPPDSENEEIAPSADEEDGETLGNL